MVDKKSSEDEFSDEGFDEEFSFDADEEHANVNIPTKKTLSFSTFPIKKILINGLLGALLLVSVYYVYQFWTKAKSKPAATKIALAPTIPTSTAPSTATTASKNPAGTKPTTQSIPAQTSTPLNSQNAASSTLSSAKEKETEAGGFSESEVAALMKEEANTKPNTQNAQKGVFVYKNAATPETPSAAPAQQTGTEAPTTSTTATPTEHEAIEHEAIKSGGIIASGESMDKIMKIETENKETEALNAAGTGPKQKAVAAQAEHKPLQKPEHEIPHVVVGPHTTPESKLVVPAVTATQTTPSTTSAAPVQNPPSPSSAEVQEMTQQINKTLDALSKLNQQMEGNLNQVKYLDAYTREVSLNVEKLNAQVTTMDNRIQGLSNLANSLSKDLGKVRNEVGYAKRVAVSSEDSLELLSPPRRHKTESPVVMDEGGDCCGGYAAPRPARVPRCAGPEEPEFVVHAVIPGRAWLKSCKGQILTVTEGETVGNYGKVLVIDAANSIVLTSSGVAFR